MFPYSVERRLSDLGAYQRQARRQPVLWILLLALLVHVGTIVHGYKNSANSSEATWSALRTADIELSAAIHANDWPGWLRWVCDLESEDEALARTVKGFEALEQKGLLDKQGLEVATNLAELVNHEAKPRSEEEWRTTFQEGIWTWERMELTQQYRGDLPLWLNDELLLYEQLNQKNAHRIAVQSFVWWGVLIIGLPFLPSALRCFQTKQHVAVSPVVRAWEPSMVTVRYLAVELTVSCFVWFLYRSIPIACWEKFWGPTLILSDASWRIGGPLLFGVVLVIRWRHLWRLLGMHLKPVVKPILGMMSLAVIFEYGLFFLLEDFTFSENLTSLSSDYEGWWGYLYMMVSGVILAPLFEEFVFRGILFQSYLRRFGFWMAMLFSTLFFVFIHFYGIYGSLSVSLFGIGACALYRATGSLWTAILFHALTNGLIFVTMWAIYYS